MAIPISPLFPSMSFLRSLSSDVCIERVAALLLKSYGPLVASLREGIGSGWVM